MEIMEIWSPIFGHFGLFLPIFENAEIENFDGGSMASDMQEALNIMGVN